MSLEVEPVELLAAARATVVAESEAIRSLADQLDDNALVIAKTLVQCRGHVLVAGAGTSHAVAQRFAHLLSCSGVPALCLNAQDCLHGGSGAIRPEDVLFVISKGGRSAEINALVSIAQKRGALTIAQTEAPDSPLGHLADQIYHIVAPPDADPFGAIASVSSLVNAAAGDLLCMLAWRLGGYTLDEFRVTHPGGAVGQRFARDAAEQG